MSEKDVEDFAINRHLSQIHSLTEWDVVGDKNFGYYNGDRFFKISRKHYPDRFTRGWLWGYYDKLEEVEEVNGALPRQPRVVIAEPKGFSWGERGVPAEEGEIEREF